MANKHWTKIRSDIVLSERMADLMDRNPLAYALYMNAKAVCDQYGRLPASPRKFKGLAAPLTSYTPAKIGKALEDMAACDVVRLYEVDGDAYLEMIGYNDVDGTDWRNVGAPEYPAPPGWAAPEDLITFLIEYSHQKGVYPERYGCDPTDPRLHRARVAPAPRPRCDRDAESESESEVERLSLPTLSPGSEEGARESGPSALPEDLPGNLCNHPELSEALRKAQPTWTHLKRNQFFSDVLQAANDPNTPVTESEVLCWIATEGTAPSHVDRADSWLRRMLAKRGELQRNGGRASPDALETQFIAKKGPRPTDPTAGQIWEMDLETYRKRHAKQPTAAAG
jgi:hypothetical protein